MKTLTVGRFSISSLLALVLVGMAVPGVNAQEAGGETVRVCTFPAPGFFARDAQGAPSGLEYDLLSGFATAAKLKATFEDEPLFSRLLEDVQGGRCQIGAAAVTVTDERKTKFEFSIPYFPNRIVVVQKTASGFAVAADLKDRRLAMVKGTLSVTLAGKIPGIKPLLVDDDDAAFQALLKGDADALVCDSAVVLHYLTKYPELGIAFPLGERSFFAFALPTGSKLVGPLNEHLKSLSKSGAFTKLLAKYFGAENADLLAEDIAKASARP